MLNDAVPAPGWRTRARLLAEDLLVFDPRRLGWVLALRTVASLLLPLTLARALGMPQLIWVGIGAYLLAIGDCMDDGDRQQPLRLVAGTALGALALATGVLAGGSLAAAVAGMLVWGMLTGMLGVYGSAFAAMSLPVAWAYVELGLPVADHSPANALLLGSLFAAGGALTLVLTLTLRFGGPQAPVRAQAASCFREVARYLEGSTATQAMSPESRVRGAIAEARRLAAQARGAAQGTSRINQRTVVLIEVADRLFSLTAALREAGRVAPPRFRHAALCIARALDGRPDDGELRRLTAQLDASAGDDPAVPFDPALLELRMGRELVRALHVLLGDEVPALPAPPPPPAVRLSAALAPLVENLDFSSVVARHALRFAVVAAAAVMVFWVFPKPFGYWVPLTVTVVLKPYAGMTLARAVQRLAGTTVGILLGLALMPLLPTPTLQMAGIGLFFFFMMAVLPFNYSLAILFLSAGLIPFEHLLNPGLQEDVGALRLVATGIGAALALVGGHLLWPTFERRGLPGLLRTCITDMAAYADAVLAAAEGRTPPARMETARRRAGLALTNLQASVQRAMTEIGGDPAAMQAALRASTALQRLINTLNALMHAAPALARPPAPLAPFRAAFVPALAALAGLAEPAQGGSAMMLRAAIPAPGALAADAFLERALERLVSELEMLRDAGAPAASLAPRTPAHA